MKKTKKSFDCVAMKRRIQEKIYNEIKGMRPQEEVEYFKRAVLTGSLSSWYQNLRPTL